MPRHALENSRPRVLLTDDHGEILRAFKRLLEPSFEIVGCVTDSRSLLEEADRLQPQVIVVDLNMPGLNGLDVCALMKRTDPSRRVVIISATDGDDIRQMARDAGASAFVSKWRAADDLASAIQNAVEQDARERAL